MPTRSLRFLNVCHQGRLDEMEKKLRKGQAEAMKVSRHKRKWERFIAQHADAEEDSVEHSQQRRQPDAATKGVAVVQGAGRASTRELLQQREETRPDSMSPTSSSCAGAIPSIAGSSRGRSRSPRRLKKRDDTDLDLLGPGSRRPRGAQS